MPDLYVRQNNPFYKAKQQTKRKNNMTGEENNNLDERPEDDKIFNNYKDGLDNLKTPTKSAKELFKDNYSKELANLLAII